jgi:hypothetical protein
VRSGLWIETGDSGSLYSGVTSRDRPHPHPRTPGALAVECSGAGVGVDAVRSPVWRAGSWCCWRWASGAQRGTSLVVAPLAGCFSTLKKQLAARVRMAEAAGVTRRIGYGRVETSTFPTAPGATSLTVASVESVPYSGFSQLYADRQQYAAASPTAMHPHAALAVSSHIPPRVP